jgi:23S rRNA pseudoU1915 N3-methylase RlmH
MLSRSLRFALTTSINNNSNSNNNNNNNNNEKRTCTLIDVANSGDRNVIKKEAEKILKCKDLTIEIQRMWNVKTRLIPVIIGATGTVSKSFRKYVSNIPGNHEVKELQKTAILGTAHILRKVLT